MEVAENRFVANIKSKKIQKKVDEISPELRMLEFQEEIESMKCEDITYLDAILEYCEKREMEYETILPLISSALKAKLIQESRDLNLIKGFGKGLKIRRQ